MNNFLQDVFGQRRVQPDETNAPLKVQAVASGIRRVMAFGNTIVISFYTKEAMKLARDNFRLTILADGKHVVREKPIPDLMRISLGWSDDTKVLVLRSPERTAPGASLLLIGHIADLQWTREVVSQ